MGEREGSPRVIHDPASPAELIYGINPVLALLRDRSRPVEAVTIQKGLHGSRLEELMALSREREVRPRLVEKPALDRLAGGGVHQGVVARAGLRVQPTWGQLLEALKVAREPLLVLLDGVEDPHNLGAVVRSAEVFGAMAVVIPRDRAAPLTAAAAKAAAGAAERLDVVRVTNLARAMGDLRQLGVRLYGLAGEADTPLGGVPMVGGGVALVLGAEGHGLRRLVRESCDALVAIPMAGEVGSLNVSVAAGVALYEVARQRRFAPGVALPPPTAIDKGEGSS